MTNAVDYLKIYSSIFSEIEMKFAFGEKLRLVRERRGLTLREVAEKAGVSESLISQIERNKVSPAIDTLLSLLEALDVDIDYIFQDWKRSRPLSLVKGNERQTVLIDGTRYERLASLAGEREGEGVEGYALEIPVHGQKGNYAYGHKGREWGIIIEGKGELVLSGEKYSLQAGDSIAFDADVPHVLRNTGEVPLKAYWIVTPPRR